jgi:hypothetical protein
MKHFDYAIRDACAPNDPIQVGLPGRPCGKIDVVG